jgi:hypothetical protein
MSDRRSPYDLSSRPYPPCDCDKPKRRERTSPYEPKALWEISGKRDSSLYPRTPYSLERR